MSLDHGHNDYRMPSREGTRAMSSQRKQNISVRMNASDLRRIRDVAARLQVRESDVFRFAVRSSLAKLTPLQDLHTIGSDLVPVFVEFGGELTTYFELDTDRLDAIINGAVKGSEKRVDRDDIELLAMAGVQDNYLYIRLKELVADNRDGLPPSHLLRRYLYDKYIVSASERRAEARIAAAEKEPEGVSLTLDEHRSPFY